MNIKMKKLMSLLLCFAMLFGMLPVEVFAAETGAETGITAEKNVAEVPAEGAPSADEPVVEDPLVEEHAAEEPVTDEPVAEEPVAEEPVAEEQVADELVFEEVAEAVKILDAEEPSLTATFLTRISEQQAKADALAEKEVVSNVDCAEIYNDLMKINDEVIAAKAAGTITSEEYDAVYSAIGSVMMVLVGYDFDPYAVEAIADLTIPQGSSADYNASGVNRNTNFTISPATDDIKVERKNNKAVRVSVDENCASGTYKISYRSNNQTYSFTVAVTASTSGDDSEDDGQIRVYVYVSSKNSSGDSWRNNLEFQELIGLTVCDGNGYFPAGEISLDADFLDGKNADREGEGLITSAQDWSDLLAALGEMNTSTLVNGYNNANPNPANFSENRGNAVYQYLSQAEGYTGTVYGWGSMHTALFRWHKLPYSSDAERSLGFDDQSVKYHLDLCFNTNKITFITGNNGIAGGVAKDGTKVDERVYITGSEIQEPRNLQIPDGYEFMGYYKDADFTTPWDGIGTPLNKNETVYIKITEVDNVVINYVVAEGVGKVDPENEAFNPITGSSAGSTATPGDDYTFVGWYSDESCTTLISSDAAFVPNKPDDGWDADKTYIYYAKFVPATADLTINKIYAGLPGGSEPTVTIFVKDSEGVIVGKVNLNASNPSGTVFGLRIGETYTVEEDADSAAVEKYILTTTYSAAEGRVMITGDADVVTVSNTYTSAVVDISGKKIWEDNQDQDGVRPESITIKLMNGSEVVETKVVTAEDNWSWSFTGLPQYAAGNEIQYSIVEETVEGYSTAYSGYNVTNTHTPATVDISGSKTWNDNNDQDGFRPESITVNLLADGVAIETVIVTEADDWAWSFTDLPKYKDHGTEIVYAITEEAVEDYTTEISGYNVTNTHKIEKTSVTVTKSWADNNDQDGLRPENVTIKLLADGEATGKTLVLSEDNGWTGTFTDLDKKAAGQDIVYTVAEEIVPNGYNATVEGNVITNTHAPEKTSVSGTKTWNDNNNQDGARPESITINLVKNGEVIDSKTVTAADGWAWTFEDLDKFENGVEIPYSFTENAVDEYSTSYEGNTVINTHTPAQTSVTVTKSWADSNDQDGIRPESVTITLVANGEATDKTLVLNAGNNWTGSFTELDKFANGEVITYTVDELNVAGYSTEITGDQTTGFTVTNSHTTETVEVSGKKTWNDNNDQDGFRPESITIKLMADGVAIETVTVTEEDNWRWNFENLPKYKDQGTLIAYTITEEAVDGYTTEINGFDVTNTHVIEKTSVTVTKSWADNDDQDGLRPEDITVKLLANGEATGKLLVLSEDNDWTGTFADLDKYAAGEEIRYTVEEVAVTGYTTVITGNQAEGYIVTNAHTPATVEVSGSKTWDDANNQDGKRPQSITIKLLANGNVAETKTVTAADGWKWSFTNLPKYENHGALISYTITEDSVDGYTTTYNGYDVTNKYSPEETSVTVSKAWADNNDQDGIRPNDVTIKLLADGKATGKTLVLNAGNGWTGSFTGLDKYAEGKVIKYTVEELTVAGYTSAITGDQTSGYTVTNTHTPATVEVSGHKIWNDNNNQDGARPRTITINLLANGKVIDSRTVTAANGWAWSFAGLPKYENHGVEIVYSITENAVEDYTTTYNGYNVINTHTPEKTSVTVTKAWKDAGDQDGIRPNDVTVKLLADGKDTHKTLVLNDANGWTGSFTGLDKFAEGKEVAYTVEELAVEGYTSVITGSQTAGYTVTNTHETETLEVSGKKTWDDANDQDGKRPESITIRLLANGVEVDRITVTEADGWAWSFKDLPKYENHGTEITYTITEDSVEGYTASYNGFNVTNKYTPEKTSVTVTKSWQDNNDQDGIRPEKITVNLLANGEKAASVKLTAEDNWTYTFTELDVYAEGEKIVYTVEEETVEGYETVITGDAAKGFTVTNSHTPETLEVSGKKTWEDDNNRDGKRPESITVRLLANGKEVASATVTAEDAWAFKFTNLPKFEAGEEIVYTVTEDAVEGYSVVYSNKSFDITNKYTPGKTSVTVTKRWIDGSDHDGIRPSSVTIYLYANDVKIAEMKLTAKDNWTGVFDDLHIYENGKRIAYTISEKSVRGYNATFTGSAENGFTVTNTHNIIPKTGDDSNLPLYVSMFGASICALAILMFLAKPKKKGKYAR